MGRFRAAVFDWAGTTVDFGSFAPADAFIKAFAEFGVQATVAQAREPMGAPKRDHIRSMTAMPEIAAQWEKLHGGRPSEADVGALYETFVPLNEQVAADHADLVPGCRDAIAALRAMGLKIGSTTGYTRSIMARVLPVAAAQGYTPDNLVCSDDLAEGRPGPLGMYKCMLDLVVHPAAAVIKVDDTEPGILEGVSAGCLTVGVALSGNAVGRTERELAEMDKGELEKLRQHATSVLKAAGADHVIDTVADLPALVRQLEDG